MQSLIDRLSKAYDDGRITRADIKHELEAQASEGRIPQGAIERLFDLIVG